VKRVSSSEDFYPSLRWGSETALFPSPARITSGLEPTTPVFGVAVDDRPCRKSCIIFKTRKSWVQADLYISILLQINIVLSPKSIAQGSSLPDIIDFPDGLLRSRLFADIVSVRVR
jgi:hypothetical protein